MKQALSGGPGGVPIRREKSNGTRSRKLGHAARNRTRPVPGIDCAWRLDLAHALQITQDPERTVDLFARHCARIVTHERVAFIAPGTAPAPEGRGRPGAGRHDIDLRLEDRLLGTLRFTRRHAFRAAEVQALEAMSADLVRPLDNALRHREAREAATRDPLTGAATRALLEDALEREVKLVHRHGDALALLMIDVDRFKEINDRFGHPAGDRCLVTIAECISQRIRSSDVLFRYGGEEFCVLLPRTGGRGARRLAERVRSAVDALRIPAGEGTVHPTVSLGVATVVPGDRAAELLARADAALYRAKRKGRNRVSAAGRSVSGRHPPKKQGDSAHDEKRPLR